MIESVKKTLPFAVCLLLISCANTDEIDDKVRNIALPQSWQADAQDKSAVRLASHDAWLQQFADSQLQQLVKQALNDNQQLKAQFYALESAKQSLRATGSTVWPALDLDFKSRRSKSSLTSNHSTNHELSLGLSYELDIWGKLSANEQQAQFNYLAAQASFEQQKQALIAQVMTAWFDIIEAQSLLALYQKQLVNTQQNLAIIEAGYQTGLNTSLDVYLTRNELNNELAQIANQEATLTKRSRVLERLLGQYPAGKLAAPAQLPELTQSISLGLPSELISRKPELKASWYQLLAKNANLAFAHKQRFPSLRLTANVNSSSSDIGDVFSAEGLGWSLLGGISQPIFYGGRLAANEERARAQLKQTEQQYLNTLYNAFSKVENALSSERSLTTRHKNTLAAQENAGIAATLAFEKYQSGLVSYTTVLDAQTRWFNAQRSLIGIQHQLLENRINLHLDLGGDFTSLPSTTQVNNNEQ